MDLGTNPIIVVSTLAGAVGTFAAAYLSNRARQNSEKTKDVVEGVREQPTLRDLMETISVTVGGKVDSLVIGLNQHKTDMHNAMIVMGGQVNEIGVRLASVERQVKVIGDTGQRIQALEQSVINLSNEVLDLKRQREVLRHKSEHPER